VNQQTLVLPMDPPVEIMRFELDVTR